MIVVKSAFLGLLILLLQNHNDDASATSRSSTVKVDAFQPPPPSSFSSSSQRTMTKTRSNRPALTSSSSSLSSSASSSSSSTQQKQQQDFSPSCCPYDAIIFDIDGTLCDSWKLGYDATQTVLRKNNIKLTTPERYHEYTRYATPDRLARHAMDAAACTTGDGDANDDNNNIDDDADADVDYVQLGNQLGNEFDELYIGLVSMETAGFFPGIKDLLEKIAVVSQSTSNESTSSSSSSSSRNGIQLGALTNACVDYAYAALRVNLGSEEGSSNDDSNNKSNDDDKLQHKINFRSIHGADTVPRPKPEPEGLYLVCKELDVDPSKAVYIGDSPSDAGAASSAGMKSIGVTWGSHPRQNLEQAPFDKLCDTIDELAIELGL